MKRSEINRALRDMEKMIDRCSFKLPPFCYFTPEEWNEKGHEYDEVRDNMLGWDITDFGMGDFDKVGFSLITLRNGNVSMDKYTKPYAEKLLYMKEGQSAAMHFHWNKMEDIINRGGGDLCMKLWKADQKERMTETPCTFQVDGITTTLRAGEILRLRPGQSITFEPYMYHTFWAEGGDCLAGEVSTVNDDTADNRFHEPLGRYPQIEEDEAAEYLLCNEYSLQK